MWCGSRNNGPPKSLIFSLEISAESFLVCFGPFGEIVTLEYMKTQIDQVTRQQNIFKVFYMNLMGLVKIPIMILRLMLNGITHLGR